MDIRNVPPQKLIHAVAEELKKIDVIRYPYKVPIKTGVCCERPPQQKDFWYIRCAAIMRQLYLHGPVGVERLRTHFGKRRRRGHAPPKFMKAGGKFIRTMLQQLEQAGLAQKVEKPRKGRVLTPKGISLLHQVAKRIAQEQGAS
jgi:small subunit ribosomal protein S19e